MLTWQAVSVGSTFYDGDRAVQFEVQVADEGADEEHNDDAVGYSNDSTMFPFEEQLNSDNSGSCPVLFLYQCKTTGGNIYKDRILEVVSLVIEPNGVSVSIASFSLLH